MHVSGSAKPRFERCTIVANAVEQGSVGGGAELLNALDLELGN